MKKSSTRIALNGALPVLVTASWMLMARPKRSETPRYAKQANREINQAMEAVNRN